MKILLLNNCRNRDHAACYDDKAAFFDLDMERHRHLGLGLSKNQLCCVAKYNEDDNAQVDLSWWVLLRQEIRTDDEGFDNRAFIGLPVGLLTLTREIAQTHPIFEKFFASDGDFKQQSIIELDVENLG